MTDEDALEAYMRFLKSLGPSGGLVFRQSDIKTTQTNPDAVAVASSSTDADIDGNKLDICRVPEGLWVGAVIKTEQGLRRLIERLQGESERLSQ